MRLQVLGLTACPWARVQGHVCHARHKQGWQLPGQIMVLRCSGVHGSTRCCTQVGPD